MLPFPPPPDRPFLLGDGAMGTELMRRGVGPRPHSSKGANLARPEVAEAIHRDYLAAGADFILADAFLKPSEAMASLDGAPTDATLAATGDAVLRAASVLWDYRDRGLVAGFGPVRPDASEAAARVAYERLAGAAFESAALAIWLETQTSASGLLAAVEGTARAAAKVSGAQATAIWASVAIRAGEDGAPRLAGCGSPLAAAWRALAATESGARVAAFGVNCWAPPSASAAADLVGQLDALLPAVVRLIFKPSADPATGERLPDDELRAIASTMAALSTKRPVLLAGCCGYGPETIALWRGVVPSA